MDPGISYLSVIAATCFTACFLVAVMHFVLWNRSREQRSYLLSSTMSAAAGVLAYVELLQSKTTDIETFVALSRVIHVVLLVLVVSLVTFIRAYLDTGPRWMIVAVTVLWISAVIQSFVLPYGVIHSEITELVQLTTVWGESFSAAIGPVNPGKFVTDLAVWLSMAFLVIAGWQAAGKHTTLLVGSATAFLFVAGTLLGLQDLGLAYFPLTAPVSFLIIIAALSYMIMDDIFAARRAEQEIDQLRRVVTLGELVGGLAHEINQPLAAILNNAQATRRFLAQSPIDLDDIRETIDDIVYDVKRAGDIVQGLRNSLRKDAPEQKVTNVRAAIEAAVRLVSGEFHSKNVSLHTDVKQGIDLVRVNPLEIEQVIVNLLLNAARAASASEKSRRKVQLTCSVIDGAAQFSVKDSGNGIDSELMDTLFDSFVSGSDDGLGLGLSICKRIVEQAGGKIWFVQREGGGAEFLFTLPIADTKKSP